MSNPLYTQADIDTFRELAYSKQIERRQSIAQSLLARGYDVEDICEVGTRIANWVEGTPPASGKKRGRPAKKSAHATAKKTKKKRKYTKRSTFWKKREE